MLVNFVRVSCPDVYKHMGGPEGCNSMMNKKPFKKCVLGHAAVNPDAVLFLENVNLDPALLPEDLHEAHEFTKVFLKGSTGGKPNEIIVVGKFSVVAEKLGEQSRKVLHG